MTLPNYVAIILAGGAAQRMENLAQHGLKTLIPIDGIPILEYIRNRLKNNDHPPVDIALNITAEQHSHIADFQMPVALDASSERKGPLAGIAAGLDWCNLQHPEIDWVLTVSGDTPFLPTDLASRLLNATIDNQTSIACAASLNRTHPPIAIWSSKLAKPMKNALDKDMRKIDRFSATYAPKTVHWTQHSTNNTDCFFNINNSHDLEIAKKRQCS